MAWRDLFRRKDDVGPGDPMSPPSPPILFGKLPGHRDFVRVGPTRHPWFERWLEAGLEGVAARRGSLSAHTVRFLLTPPGEVLTGVFAPSKDAVGREFPVAILRSRPAPVAAPAPALWYEETGLFVRAATLLAGAGDMGPERLERALAALEEAGPEPQSPPAPSAPEVAEPSISAEMDAAAAAVAAVIAAAEGAGTLAARDGDVQPQSHPSSGAGDPTAPNPLSWTDVLGQVPALAGLESAFGSVAQGGPAHAMVTLAGACDAVSRAEKNGVALTFELPAPDLPSTLFWLALAARSLGGRAPLAVLANPERLVLALGAAAHGPALMVAYCLGASAGPRHWLATTNDADLRAESVRKLPAGVRAELEAAPPAASLLDILRTFG